MRGGMGVGGGGLVAWGKCGHTVEYHLNFFYSPFPYYEQSDVIFLNPKLHFMYEKVHANEGLPPLQYTVSELMQC